MDSGASLFTIIFLSVAGVMGILHILQKRMFLYYHIKSTTDQRDYYFLIRLGGRSYFLEWANQTVGFKDAKKNRMSEQEVRKACGDHDWSQAKEEALASRPGSFKWINPPSP